MDLVVSTGIHHVNIRSKVLREILTLRKLPTSSNSTQAAKGYNGNTAVVPRFGSFGPTTDAAKAALVENYTSNRLSLQGEFFSNRKVIKSAKLEKKNSTAKGAKGKRIELLRINTQNANWHQTAGCASLVYESDGLDSAQTPGLRLGSDTPATSVPPTSYLATKFPLESSWVDVSTANPSERICDTMGLANFDFMDMPGESSEWLDLADSPKPSARVEHGSGNLLQINDDGVINYAEDESTNQPVGIHEPLNPSTKDLESSGVDEPVDEVEEVFDNPQANTFQEQAPSKAEASVQHQGETSIEEPALGEASQVPSNPEQVTKILPSFNVETENWSQTREALDLLSLQPVSQARRAANKEHQVESSLGSSEPPKAYKEADVGFTVDVSLGQLLLQSVAPALSSVVDPPTAGDSVHGIEEVGSLIESQPSITSLEQPLRLDQIDLDAEFGQSATDLDDGAKEIYINCGQSVIDSNSMQEHVEMDWIGGHDIGSRLSTTRYIPGHVAEFAEYQIRQFPQVPALVLQANVYWDFIKAATDSEWFKQGCPKMFLPREFLRERDPINDIRELLGLDRKINAPSTADRCPEGGFAIHHYNLLNDPVYQANGTPSALSCWAAMTSGSREQIKDGVSWKAVVSSQAAKQVDPVTLDPEVPIPDNLHGSALRNFIVGLTTIRYLADGTWDPNMYGPHDEEPQVMSRGYRNAMEVAYSRNNGYPGLQRPHFMGPEDGDVVVNDDGTGSASPRAIMKYEKGWETADSCGSTNLGFVLNAKIDVLAGPVLYETDIDYSNARVDDPGDGDEDVRNLEESNEINDVESTSDPDPATVLSPSSTKDEGDDESSAAETDIVEETSADREPVHYVNATGSLKAAERPVGANATHDEVPVERALAPDRKVHSGARVEQPKVKEPMGQTPYNVDPPVDSSPPESRFLDRFYKESGDLMSAIKARPPPIAAANLREGSDDESEVAKEEFDGNNGITDHNSVWHGPIEPSDHSQAEFLSRFADSPTSSNLSEFDDLQLSSASPTSEGYEQASNSPLRQGRYLSPNKMFDSTLDRPHTPAQSPPEHENFGVWEENEDRSYDTPDEHRPGYFPKNIIDRGMGFFDDDVFRLDRTEEFVQSPEERMPEMHQASKYTLTVPAGDLELPESDGGSDLYDDQDITEHTTETEINSSGGSDEEEGSPGMSEEEAYELLFGEALQRTAEDQGDLSESTKSRVCSLSPVKEVDSGTPVLKNKKVHTVKPSRYPKVVRNVSKMHVNVPKQDFSEDNSFVSGSAVSVQPYAGQGNSNHSRSSSSSAANSEKYNVRTSISSLSEPLSDEEFAEIEEEFVMQAAAKLRGRSASQVPEFVFDGLPPLRVPVVIDAAALDAALAVTATSHNDPDEASKDGETSNGEELAQMEGATTDDGGAGTTNLAESPGDNPATLEADDPTPSHAAPHFSICHYQVANIPPSMPSRQTTRLIEAGDVMESENSIDPPTGGILAAGDVVEAENAPGYGALVRYRIVQDIPRQRSHGLLWQTAVGVGHIALEVATGALWKSLW